MVVGFLLAAWLPVLADRGDRHRLRGADDAADPRRAGAERADAGLADRGGARLAGRGEAYGSDDDDGADHPSRLPAPREPARASRAGRAAARRSWRRSRPRRSPISCGSRRRWPTDARDPAGASGGAISRRWRRAAPAEGFAPIDGDTFLSPGTLAAARRAAGAVVRGGRHGDGAARSRNAFCAVRPPGHHAETATAMGFCFFGNVVIGARHALEAHGLERVAIVDFDVHHGNGTQDLVWDDARILLRLDPPDAALSRHRARADETGRLRADRQRAAAARGERRGVPRRRCSSGCCRRSRRTSRR